MKTTSIVYIVDDEEKVLKSLEWLIASIGYKVETYISAQTFIDNYNSNAYSCLILDVRMPDISGLELLKRVKQDRPDLEIIIMTGLGEAETYLEAKDEGAFDYLIKPINIPILRLMISKVFHQN